MPYNTRRKSLSLSELGIAIPKRARSATHTTTSLDCTVDADGPPVKKCKQLHHDSTSPLLTTSMSPPRSTNIRIKEEQRMVLDQLSPPPSPLREGYNKVDLEGINDDIVIATIRQLETTGNRPLFIRELGAILAQTLACVEKSANPIALISSRLTQYLGRSWPSVSPCPLAKDLSTVHPRRLYFYLTTMPRQPVPDISHSIPKAKRAIISPSLSSASVVEDGEEDEDGEGNQQRQRSALSPSPEVDLSSPELDERSDQPTLPGRPFSEQGTISRTSSTPTSLVASRRAASPQLEKEERDFKQTANALYEQAQQYRKTVQSKEVTVAETITSLAPAPPTSNVTISVESDDGVNDATTLFGHLKSPSHPQIGFSSPVIRPQQNSNESTSLEGPAEPPQHENTSPFADSSDERASQEKMEVDTTCTSPEDMLAVEDFTLDELQSLENIELDELEDMFRAY